MPSTEVFASGEQTGEALASTLPPFHLLFLLLPGLEKKEEGDRKEETWNRGMNRGDQTGDEQRPTHHWALHLISHLRHQEVLDQYGAHNGTLEEDHKIKTMA